MSLKFAKKYALVAEDEYERLMKKKTQHNVSAIDLETPGQQKLRKDTTRLAGVISNPFLSSYEKAEEQRRLKGNIDAERKNESRKKTVDNLKNHERARSFRRIEPGDHFYETSATHLPQRNIYSTDLKRQLDFAHSPRQSRDLKNSLLKGERDSSTESFSSAISIDSLNSSAKTPTQRNDDAVADYEDGNNDNQKENHSDVLARLKHFDNITLRSKGTASVHGAHVSKKKLNTFIDDYIQKKRPLNDTELKNAITHAFGSKKKKPYVSLYGRTSTPSQRGGAAKLIRHIRSRWSPMR